MDLLELIDTLEEQVNYASKIPMTNKIALNKDEMLNVIQAIKERLPAEIKQAQDINVDRQKIIAEAKKEAGNVMKEAEQRYQAMLNENDIVRAASDKARTTVENANRKSKEIKLGTIDYVDGLLAALESSLEEKIKIVREDRKSLSGK